MRGSKTLGGRFSPGRVRRVRPSRDDPADRVATRLAPPVVHAGARPGTPFQVPRVRSARQGGSVDQVGTVGAVLALGALIGSHIDARAWRAPDHVEDTNAQRWPCAR